MQVSFDHLAPLRLDFLIGFCVAIARQIYQIKHFIYIIKVDGLGFAGLGRSSRQAFPVHDPVDEGGFANITLSGKAISGSILSGSLLVMPQTVSN